MQNKTPQGKPDPIPTPEHDLERYGVWVKAEPQDLTDDTLAAEGLPAEASAESPDAVLLAEEEELLDSFDLPDLDTAVDAPSEEPIGGEAVDSAGMDFDDFESLAPLEDMADIAEADSSEAHGELDEGVVESTVIDMSLDDLDFDEVEAEAPEAAPSPAERKSASSDSFETTEISIEDFGLDEDTPAGPALEDIERFAADAAEPSASDEEFESLDIDLQFDDTIPSAESEEAADAFSQDEGMLDVTSEFESVDLDSIGVDEPESKPAPAPRAELPEPEAVDDSEGISLDSFIDSDDDASIGIIPDLEIENVSIGSGDSGFDDVRAVSDDLASTAPSSDLLKQIASELSSIKQELVSLRDQLSSIKAAGAAVGESGVADESAEEIADASGGFFDDEDDDTIALTGDELDNILNTADFTEETVSEEPEAEAPELSVPDDVELLPEDGVYEEPSEPGIETIELDDESDIAADAGLGIDAVEPLDGVTPLTSGPDDTSFLDEEIKTDEFEELEGMPIEDVPLVEPSDSDLDIDLAPAFEEGDEDLPVIEAADDDTELVLDIDAEAAPVVSTVDSFEEPIDEVEDAMDLEEVIEPEELGGLELHAENPAEPVEELLQGDEDLEELSIDDFSDELAVEEPLAEEAPLVLETPETVQGLDLSYHPDEIATSLDDSLFVGSAQEEGAEELEPVEEEAIADESGTVELESPIDEIIADEIPEAIEPSETVAEASAEPAMPAAAPPKAKAAADTGTDSVPDKLKRDVKSVLVYLDQLLASLPEEKIEEFASSEYYDTYKRLFDDLGLL
ncbi:MAG TPA: hypothetical protein PLH55_09985 [Spirochaetales bacterium]|nr:hypothetical protein [Spirochaetales bacterium]